MAGESGSRIASERTPEERYRAASAAVFRALRAAHGWSLRQFGDAIGMAHTTLYAVERGEATPGIDLLARVAATCDLDLPGILRMIADEMTAGEGAAAAEGRPTPDLTELFIAVSSLSPGQRRETAGFVDYLRYRDRPSDETGPQ